MHTLEFNLKPVPKGRPRFSARGKFVRVHTDPKTKAFEKSVHDMAMEQFQRVPLEGPLAVAIMCRLEKPKSVKRKSPTARPDLDNYVKAILDGLNEVCWIDDSQIVVMYCEKTYGEPGIRVSIWELEE